MRVSFIIPAFNEEKNIKSTLDSIFNYSKISENFEIIVVDNNSTDNTVDIAKLLGAKVKIIADVTVATLRNIGVEEATGDVFIFLDADILLTQSWFDHIEEVLEQLKQSPKLITGSHVIPLVNNNWFHKYWFSAFASEPESEHLGSAHLIITKEFFKDLNGFDGSLETAEDFDLCTRAKALGGRIKNDLNLQVIHPDFPSTIVEFVKRESWHGKGDCANLKLAIKSKSLIAGLLFYGLILLSVIFFFINYNLLASLCLSAALCLLFISSFSKFRHYGMRSVFINALIFIPYFFGRILSLFLKKK